MHELLAQVLENCDLSRAGDLFSVDDQKIVGDLSEVLSKIREISSASDFLHSNNIQSVVEICITRATSAIRDTGTIEQHAHALVALLESCLNHDLRPSSKDEDPPHAKIASDIVSCIFLNHSKKPVMKLALPVAIKFLHRGNKELSHNLSSYLSLAAVNNAELLSPHVQPIVDSVISGNYALARVLPSIYVVKKEPIHDHLMALISLLPLCESDEKLNLLALFELVAKHKPQLLESNLPQLSSCLGSATTAGSVLKIFQEMASVKPQLFTEYLRKMRAVAQAQPVHLALVAHIMGTVGRLGTERGRECLEFLVSQLAKGDHNTQVTLLREVKRLTDAFPPLLGPFVPQVCAQVPEPVASSTIRFYLQQLKADAATAAHRAQVVNQTGGVTIVKVGGGGSRQDLSSRAGSRSSVAQAAARHQQQQLLVSCSSPEGPGNSRSLGHLGSGQQLAHRSMGRLPSSSSAHHSQGAQAQSSGSRLSSPCGLHMSLSKLSSSSPVNRSLSALSSRHNLSSCSSAHTSRVSSCGVTVTTTSTHKSMSIPTLIEEAQSSPALGVCRRPVMTVSITSHIPRPIPEHSSGGEGCSHKGPSPSPPPLLPPGSSSSAVGGVASCSSSSATPPPYGGGASSSSRLLGGPNSSSLSSSGNNNSQHKGSAGGGASSATEDDAVLLVPRKVQSNSQRISVFEPYPMRDAVQHFCEKHLDKIKAYMQTIFVKLPLPSKCTIEERRSKKHAILQFACQGKGEHCLYSKSLFVMKTKNPRIWIHLMFLALQARASNALSTRESSVSSLKNCWDTLKYDNKSFLALVTSSFPSAKDQDNLIGELRCERFFDVFEYNGPLTLWGCFLCNHPDRAQGFLQEGGEPVIEGQLKEKKKKWKLFRHWRTRYFTLSGAHLSYRGLKDDKEAQPIEVSQIRSVRPIGSRGRNIPKAFEIFTSDKTFVLKAKDSKNTEQWVQCLSIALARSHAKEVVH
uniref:Putative ph domain protein melted n=1 Tax=Ixodes ricinus TaxID=34613 RepID=A0A131XW49_IXORI